jgi:hypothetical protein
MILTSCVQSWILMAGWTTELRLMLIHHATHKRMLDQAPRPSQEWVGEMA